MEVKHNEGCQCCVSELRSRNRPASEEFTQCHSLTTHKFAFILYLSVSCCLCLSPVVFVCLCLRLSVFLSLSVSCSFHLSLFCILLPLSIFSLCLHLFPYFQWTILPLNHMSVIASLLSMSLSVFHCVCLPSCLPAIYVYVEWHTLRFPVQVQVQFIDSKIKTWHSNQET